MTNLNNENTTMNFDLANAVPHCAVMLVLDTSHSMWGQGLADMMASLKAFYGTVTDHQFLNAQVDVAAVSMGDNLGMLEDFTPLHSSDLPNRAIRPKGDTPVGAALELALEKLQAQVKQYQASGISHVTPHLILLSDGRSTDDFQPAAEQIHSLVGAGKLFCRAIALGNDADFDALGLIAGKEQVVRTNFGGMPQAFAGVGQLVSQTYEEEAQVVIAEEVTPISQHDGTEYLLDGSNIMYWDKRRSGVTLCHLLAITGYMKKQNLPFQVFFDATAPHMLKKDAPAAVSIYEALLKNDPMHFHQVPAGTRADDFLLLQANSNKNAIILTQDLFRDHVDRYPWLKTEKRVIPGMVMNDQIFFPEISLQIPIFPSEIPGWENL